MQAGLQPVSYTHLDVYKRQAVVRRTAYGEATSDFPVSLLTDHADINLSLIHICCLYCQLSFERSGEKRNARRIYSVEYNSGEKNKTSF